MNENNPALEALEKIGERIQTELSQVDLDMIALTEKANTLRMDQNSITRSIELCRSDLGTEQAAQHKDADDSASSRMHRAMQNVPEGCTARTLFELLLEEDPQTKTAQTAVNFHFSAWKKTGKLTQIGKDGRAAICKLTELLTPEEQTALAPGPQETEPVPLFEDDGEGVEV